MDFKLYLLFTVSFFLHIPARIPFLGSLRCDLLLLVATAVAILLRSGCQGREVTTTDKLLRFLLAYIVLTIPFVQWPGSVLWIGIPNFAKAVVFYYFTVSTVTSMARLKTFIAVFLGCQILRVAEPLYLHIADGYWGSGAYMGEGEFMMRLSGAPSDVVNPNGLAFVALSVIPFLYCLLFSGTMTGKIVFLASLPGLLYALVLTGSRTGLVGLAAIVLGVIAISKRKIILTLVIGLCGTVAFLNLDEGHKERYLSLFSDEGKHAATAAGRTDSFSADLEVALETPFIGHGLGTSAEARVHASQAWQPAHNLVFEVWQEIGLIGLIIYFMLVTNIAISLVRTSRFLKNDVKADAYIGRLTKALQIWLFMNVVFSLASYGLSSYEWYLLAGLSVISSRLMNET